MPELPEVETIKRIIEPQIKGQAILSVDVRNVQIIAYPETNVFRNSLAGKAITGMSRRKAGTAGLERVPEAFDNRSRMGRSKHLHPDPFLLQIPRLPDGANKVTGCTFLLPG